MVVCNVHQKEREKEGPWGDAVLYFCKHLQCLPEIQKAVVPRFWNKQR